MKALKLYDIKFSGLKNGQHQYKFHLDKTFFDQFNFDEFKQCDIDILIDFNKSDSLLEFKIHSDGTVNIPCDISGEYYDQPIKGELDFIVKFGEAYNDDREDLIVIPYHSHFINVAQQVYESVLLNVPVKRIHPDIISGKMKSDNTKYIVNYQEEAGSKEIEETNTNDIDPRWAALKKIITDKK
jgi:uncharacterized metal-binding protein YceD (DUF177 family)